MLYEHAQWNEPMHYEDEVTILLIEDDSIDQRAVLRAFTKRGITNRVEIASDGIEALHVLRGTSDREKIQQPYVILLDLNMPRIGGLELLKILREDDELKRSVVFVLTSSDVPEDIRKAYENSISGYIVKEHVGQDFINLIQLIEDFKLTVRFPPR